MTGPGYPTGQQAFQQQGWGAPPGYAPQPTNQQYQNQPMQPAYPGFAQPPMQPQYQVPQPQPGQDLNARIPNDPSIPQELRGKTWGEALRYYGIMREDFVQRQNQQRQQPQQSYQPQNHQPPSQYNPQQTPRQPNGQWQHPQNNQRQVDPVEETVRGVLNEVLPQALAPIVQPMQQQALLSTYNGVKGRYQDWQNFEGEILGSMQGSDPATLQNPAAWEAAYFHAKGKAMTMRQLPAGQQQQQMNQGPSYGPPMGYPAQQQPVYQAPPQQGYQAPFGSSFVEGPTPPAPGMYAAQQDPRDAVFARRFNMPLEVYQSWKGGRIGLMQTPQGQQQQQQPQQGYPQYGMPQQGMPQQPMTQFGQPQNPPGWFQPAQMNGGGYAP